MRKRSLLLFNTNFWILLILFLDVGNHREKPDATFRMNPHDNLHSISRPANTYNDMYKSLNYKDKLILCGMLMILLVTVVLACFALALTTMYLTYCSCAFVNCVIIPYVHMRTLRIPKSCICVSYINSETEDNECLSLNHYGSGVNTVIDILATYTVLQVWDKFFSWSEMEYQRVDCYMDFLPDLTHALLNTMTLAYTYGLVTNQIHVYVRRMCTNTMQWVFNVCKSGLLLPGLTCTLILIHLHCMNHCPNWLHGDGHTDLDWLLHFIYFKYIYQVIGTTQADLLAILPKKPGHHHYHWPTGVRKQSTRAIETSKSSSVHRETCMTSTADLHASSMPFKNPTPPDTPLNDNPTLTESWSSYPPIGLSHSQPNRKTKIQHQVFLHVGGKIHTLTFDENIMQVDSILSFIDNDIGIPSHLFKLVISGKVIKPCEQLHFPLSSENIYATVFGRGGCPSDSECSNCKKTQPVDETFRKITNFSEVKIMDWAMNQMNLPANALLCDECFHKIIDRCAAEETSTPSKRKRRRTTKMAAYESTSMFEPSSGKCSKCNSMLDRNKKSITLLAQDKFSYAKDILGYTGDEIFCQTCFRKLREQTEAEMSGAPYNSPCRKRRSIEPVESHSCILSNYNCEHENGSGDGNNSWLIKSTTDWQTVQELTKLDVEQTDTVYLCNKHRLELNSKMNPRDCCLCNDNLDFTNTNQHSSHNKTTISTLVHFVEKNFVDAEVTRFSRLCPSCQRMLHTYSSSSENIQPIIAKLNNDIEELGRPNNSNDIEKFAELQTLVKTACVLEKGEPLLLCSTYTWYLTFIQALEETSDVVSPMKELTDYKKRKINLNILSTLGTSVDVNKSDNTKKSLLLTPKKFDHMKHLHEVMYTNFNNKSSDYPAKIEKLQKKVKRFEKEVSELKKSRSLVDKIKDMSKEMSCLIDNDIKKVREEFENIPIEDLPKITQKSLIQTLHPTLWNFFCILTGTKDEQKLLRKNFDWSRHYLPDLKDASHALQRRMTRRVFLFHCVLFTRDEKTNGLQTLLSDTLNKYSLSAKLMNFFNHLGVCVSYTTYRRFVENISSKIGKVGPSKFLAPIKTFTVCTIDNIDKAMPGARIKCTDEKRPAMHATGIMFFQPGPNKYSSAVPDTEVNHCSICNADVIGDNTLCQCCGREFSEDQNIIGKSLARSSMESKRRVASDFHVRVPPLAPNYTKRKPLTIEDFDMTEAEHLALKHFEKETVTYALERTINARSSNVNEENHNILLPGLKCKLYLEHQSEPCEKSKYAYCPLLYKHADCIHTVSQCLDITNAYAKKLKSDNEPLLIAGDAKTYVLLQKLKRQEGERLDWVIPFIGDWHLLKNTQPVLMKIFWDAGLKDMSKENFKTDFYQKKLKDCTNFRTAHDFFLQIWEAFYQYQITAFLKWREEQDPPSDDITEPILQCLCALEGHQNEADFSDVECFIQREKALAQSICHFQTDFTNYRETMSKKDKTFSFWDSFIHKQVAPYIGLWISIRSGNWNLRVASIRKLSPLFHAYDRVYYAKIIPQHLADIGRMPEEILEPLRNGGFVISLSGTPYASVALDEAHEMTINKDLKSAITIPSEDYVITKSEYLPYRALVQNMLDDIFMSKRKTLKHRNLSKSLIMSEQKNIQQYRIKIEDSNALEMPQEKSNKLFQLYTDKFATPEQERHLLGFEKIGQELFELYVKLSILKLPSDCVPQKRQNLKTFGKVGETKRKRKQREDTLKQQYSALKSQVAESKETNLPISQLGQVIALPRAIAYDNKLPVKGTKSMATGFLTRRYKDKKVIFEGNLNTRVDTIILEGMFVIQSGPRQPCRNFSAYAEYLLKRWLVPWICKGTAEIHVVFDDPERNGTSPKDIERFRRDQQGTQNKCKDLDSITSDTKMPRCPWKDFLSNRHNKRKLCHFLSTEWCNMMQNILRDNQKFIVGGGFMDTEQRDYAWCLTSGGLDRKYFRGNHEEADTRVWLHAIHTKGTTIQIFSPDTDTYHIGLNLLSNVELSQKVIYVQINRPTTDFDKFVDMKALEKQLSMDTELYSYIGLEGALAPFFTQVIYICSGCDYVSYFTKIGKSTFYRLAFRQADFILHGYPLVISG